MIDQYNSNQMFKATKITPLPGTSLYKRDDRDLCTAYTMSTKGFLKNSTGASQDGVAGQSFEVGDVILIHGDSVHKVDKEIFKRTYVSPEGDNPPAQGQAPKPH